MVNCGLPHEPAEPVGSNMKRGSCAKGSRLLRSSQTPARTLPAYVSYARTTGRDARTYEYSGGEKRKETASQRGPKMGDNSLTRSRRDWRGYANATEEMRRTACSRPLKEVQSPVNRGHSMWRRSELNSIWIGSTSEAISMDRCDVSLFLPGMRLWIIEYRCRLQIPLPQSRLN